MFSAFCLDCYGSPCSCWRNKHGGGAARLFWALLYILRTLSSCSKSDQAPRFKPKFNWRRGKTKEETEGKVELGEDVKNDEREKWIVKTESARSGLTEEAKKRDKTKTKQINSTLLSFAYICTKEGRLLHNTIYLYNIYHVTAIHLPSNHSHRDIRSKTKDIHIHIYLKIKKKQKKKYTDTRIASMSRNIDRKKKRKEKGQHLKCRASARIFSLLIYLVASLDWSAGRKLIDEMYCLYRYIYIFFLSLRVCTHKDRISLTVFTVWLRFFCQNYLQSRLYHKAAASFTYDLRDSITPVLGEILKVQLKFLLFVIKSYSFFLSHSHSLSLSVPLSYDLMHARLIQISSLSLSLFLSFCRFLFLS